MENGIWSDSIMPHTGKKWNSLDQEKFFKYYTCERIYEYESEAGIQFTNLINEIDNPDFIKDSDKCGTILMLRNVRFAKNDEYVDSFEVGIVNISQTVKSLMKYRENFVE